MKKKVIIVLSLILIVIIILSILLINNIKTKKVIYSDLTIDKINNLTSYTLNIQISKMSDDVEVLNLNYFIEENNYSLDVYENGINTFYQKYNGKYYKEGEEIKEIKYANYMKYINVLKYIKDIKKEKDTYKGIINSNDLKEIIKTDEDGIVFMKIENNIIKSISIVSKNNTNYTINIDYKY